MSRPACAEFRIGAAPRRAENPGWRTVFVPDFA